MSLASSNLLTLPKEPGFDKFLLILVSIKYSIFFSILSDSFRPSGPNNFNPLSLYRLCDAVIIIPKLALIFFVIIARPFVGKGPRVNTSIPADAKPDTKAGSKV